MSSAPFCPLHKIYLNKHTVSIAEAIHVPYRPQQISKRHNSRKDTKVKNFLYYVNTNQYPKFDVNILQDDREKCGNLNKRFKSGQTQ